MSFSLYKTILTQLVAVKFAGRISYDFYNEPLMHPELELFVKHTKEVLPATTVHLYTNGTLLNAQKISQLDEAGVDKFVVTRHIQDEESSNYVFENVFDELLPITKTKVIYRGYRDLNLVNRGGLLKHLGGAPLPLHPCHLPSHMLTVTVDGRVLSCFEDYNENLVFGDLKTEKLIDIWNREPYRLFRRSLKQGMRLLYEPCKGCNRTEALPPFNV